MSSTNTVSRSLHDVGLAAWFGGTLANAIALNAAAGAAGSPQAAGAVTNAGWDRWTPANGAAIGAHLVGSIGQLAGNRDRVRNDKRVATMALVKTGLTAGALGVSAWSRMLGKRVSQRSVVAVDDATTPSARTPHDVGDAQRQLTTLQWVVPALTGALVVVSSFAGEQQRPRALLSGLGQRLAG